MNKRPTKKQKKLVELMITDNYRTKGDLVIKAGYAESVREQPSKVIESEGVQKLIREAGLIEGLADNNVLRVIEKAIQDRDYKQGAQVALKWLQLKYNTTSKFQDNRRVTINNPEPEKIDNQTHIYISNKYNIPLNYLRSYLKNYQCRSDKTTEKPQEGTLGEDTKE